ncbi:MAG: ABC transporter ATP-binding protein [Marinilabiliaceae bacterium]|nr:ABC transporter ATP-binding protein [Marinilabiliaceae bacterium]
MENSISIHNVQIGYQSGKTNKLIAKNLNADLKSGEMTCLLGSNGTGKSTLLKTICGFINLLDGEILVKGKNISLINEKELAKIVAAVLTEKIQVHNASVFELVSYGRSPFTGFLGRLSSEDKNKVNQAIEICGINHKKYSLLSSLSDGERQKATIAKALAQDTPIILLDEPTAFLDLSAKVEIMQLLRKLTSETGKSVLMSTHDLDLALQMSDRLWLLSNNGITAGSPEDLLLNNAFQHMFNKKGIEFDNKTGMFKVAYQLQNNLAIKGHGFEYVLLRRALMRKGINPVKAKENENMFIAIENSTKEPYVLWNNNMQILKTGSVENLISETLSILN